MKKMLISRLAGVVFLARCWILIQAGWFAPPTLAADDTFSGTWARHQNGKVVDVIEITRTNTGHRASFHSSLNGPAYSQAEERDPYATSLESRARFLIPASSDSNVLEDKNPKLSLYADKDNFIVDGDQSRGRVRIIFNDSRLGTKQFSQGRLLFWVADVPDAESRQGLLVFRDDKAFAWTGSLRRNSLVEVPLDLSSATGQGRIELTLAAAGSDGVYICSSASRRGPALLLDPPGPNSDSGVRDGKDDGKNLKTVLIPAEWDENPVSASDRYANDANFIIDGDESRGWVRLVFQNSALAGGNVRTARLLLKTSDAKYADSAHGLIVRKGSAVLGRSGAVGRNSLVEIPLALASPDHRGRLELLLAAAGTDGVYIRSRASGFGSALQVEVPCGGETPDTALVMVSHPAGKPAVIIRMTVRGGKLNYASFNPDGSKRWSGTYSRAPTKQVTPSADSTDSGGTTGSGQTPGMVSENKAGNLADDSQLPIKVLFDGSPGDKWETIGVAGGNFARFGRFENNEMVISVPEGHYWGKTGILSKEPILHLDDLTLDRAPYRLIITTDPARTSGFVLSLDRSKIADMWLSHRIWVHPTKAGIYFHSNKGDSFAMPENWNGVFSLVIGNGWCSLEPSGGTPVKKQIRFNPGERFYMILTSSATKEQEACSLALKSITLQKIAPQGMTPLERWELVDDEDFDPDAYLRALAMGEEDSLEKAEGCDEAATADSGASRPEEKRTASGHATPDISGKWQVTNDNSWVPAPFSWTFTPMENGRFNAVENGFLQGQGQAVVKGRKISMEFTFQAGGRSYEGRYDLVLNRAGDGAEGKWETSRPSNGTLVMARVSTGQTFNTASAAGGIHKGKETDIAGVCHLASELKDGKVLELRLGMDLEDVRKIYGRILPYNRTNLSGDYRVDQPVPCVADFNYTISKGKVVKDQTDYYYGLMVDVEPGSGRESLSRIIVHLECGTGLETGTRIFDWYAATYGPPASKTNDLSKTVSILGTTMPQRAWWDWNLETETGRHLKLRVLHRIDFEYYVLILGYGN